MQLERISPLLTTTTTTTALHYTMHLHLRERDVEKKKGGGEGADRAVPMREGDIVPLLHVYVFANFFNCLHGRG